MKSVAERIVDALVEAPEQTARELTASVGVDRSMIYKGLRVARRLQLIYTSGWTSQQNEHDVRFRSAAAIYTAGQGEDVPRPAKLPRSEVRKRHAQPKLVTPLDPLAQTRPVLDATRAYITAHPRRRAFACLLGQMGAL